MKILVHDYAGHPFQVQLSRALAKKGHDVLHVFSGSNVTPQGALQKSATDPQTFNVKPIVLPEKIQKASLIKRRGQEIDHGNRVVQVIESFRPEIIISANSPLDTQRIIQAAAASRGIPSVYWLQDLVGVATHMLLKRKLPIVGELAGRYYMAMEKRLLKESAAVVTICAEFEPILKDLGVAPSKVHTIENWAPLEEMPQRPKVNPWSERNSLSETFNFVYSGTLGMKHNPKLLLNLAATMKDRPDVRVLVISEGPGRRWLEEQQAQLNLPNLILKDYQPFSDMPEVLGSADVLIAILEPSAGIFSVPSKVSTYMCSGRPLLMAVPGENLAAKIVKRVESGVIGEPADEEAFLANAKRLYEDAESRTRMGANGRKHAEVTFDIDKISAKFEAIFRASAR